MILKEKIITEEDGTRIDKFLATKFSQVPRTFFSSEIKSGNVLVNANQVNPSHKIKRGDRIELNCVYEDDRKIALIPQGDILLKIVFQNEDFLIIDKPAGISVHPSEKETSGTLVNGLIDKFPKIKNVGEDELRPGIVHRLDKDTKGLLIVALNQNSFDFFKRTFKSRKIKKKYIALTWGKIKKEGGRIEGYIGKSKANPTKQSFSQSPEKVINPKHSLSFYEVINFEKDKTLVEVEIKTGRKHQIRVHLHSIGHSIVGDKKYSNKILRDKNREYKHQQLKAFYLEFQFLDGEDYKFELKREL